MKNESVRLSVVIPTRERANTLAASLKTVVTQDYDNLQIVVSDNFSNDDTKAVVDSFSDPRIVYTNTGVRLGMSSNWEHGLSLVDGDYVMFLGDDDGLLPNACADVSTFFVATKAPVLIWHKPTYSWPCSFADPNQLSVVLRNALLQIPSKLILKAIAYGLTSYGRLPVLYSGFVSVDILRTIKTRTNNFFCSVTPDVYSGIVIASQIDSYFYSMRPFSINGGSSQSNGQSLNRPDQLSKVFFAESDIPIHSNIPVIAGSPSACIAEAFLQAQDHGLLLDLSLNEKKYLDLIFRELKELRNKESQIDGLRKLSSLRLSSSLRSKVESYLAKLISENDGASPSITEGNDLDERSWFLPSRLVVQADKFGVYDVFTACQFVYNVYGEYCQPKKVKRITLAGVLISKMASYFENKISKYKLPW